MADYRDVDIKVVIPALNEAQAISKVIQEIPNWVKEIIVVDNGSTDETGKIAAAAGASVIREEIRGYGRSCIAGIKYAQPCDIVVFLDGDSADAPQEMGLLIEPIIQGNADLVIGSRVKGKADPGALSLQQRLGNSFACLLLKIFWRVEWTDLGPFRAIRYDRLLKLDLTAPTFGWTVEMQARAAKYGLNVVEIPVSYRNRIGKSKISGTIKGVILAGIFIIGTILREACSGGNGQARKSRPHGGN